MEGVSKVEGAFSKVAGLQVSALEDVKAEGNWMWASKLPGEGALMYDTALALREVRPPYPAPYTLHTTNYIPHPAHVMQPRLVPGAHARPFEPQSVLSGSLTSIFRTR